MRQTATMVVVSLAVALGAADLRAATPEAEQQARRLFERAEEHFKAGLFAEALAEYQDGYAHLPLPGFLINIAQCQRRQGDLKGAQSTYRKFIMVAPDSPYVPEVKDLVAELDKLVASEEAEPPAETKPAPLQPGRAESWASPPAPAAASLVEAPAVPPPPAAAGRSRWWLWGTLGAAVLVGAATTAYLLRAPGTTTVHDGSLGTLRR